MYFNTGKHSILRIENFGETIVLDDKSRWKVDLMDKTKSMMWMILDDVTVVGSGNTFKITHVKRKETVGVSHLPG